MTRTPFPRLSPSPFSPHPGAAGGLLSVDTAFVDTKPAITTVSRVTSRSLDGAGLGFFFGMGIAIPAGACIWFFLAWALL